MSQISLGGKLEQARGDVRALDCKWVKWQLWVFACIYETDLVTCVPCVSHVQVKVKINAMSTARIVPAGKREDVSDSESGGWRAETCFWHVALAVSLLLWAQHRWVLCC